MTDGWGPACVNRRAPEPALPASHDRRNQHMTSTSLNSGLSPHAVRLGRVAALINDHQLPPAAISIAADGTHVQITATGCELVENTVRRWAAALAMLVTESPVDDHHGMAATSWSTSGFDGTGVWWLIAGTEPIPCPVSA